MNIIVLGLSITSSWGNGHATTYRGLLKELKNRGHKITFLERDVSWYAENRDMPEAAFCDIKLYNSLADLKGSYRTEIADADMVIVGSYVTEGVKVGQWVLNTAGGIKAFYDIDTPVTMSRLMRNECEYLSASQIGKYDLYLSFTGGPVLNLLEAKYGSPMARPLYCSVDPAQYFPEDTPVQWDLGYLGTYSSDRQPAVDNFMLKPAREMPKKKFTIAGPQYPVTAKWPVNLTHFNHLPPEKHRDFYNAQKFTLNITRRDMIKAGYSPSVRLFEAAACGTPIISDFWEGLDTLFSLGTEILIAENTGDIKRYLLEIDEESRRAIGMSGRGRIISKHTSAHRAEELEGYASELLKKGATVNMIPDA